MPLTAPVNLLAGPLDRLAVNETELTGGYDFDLQYALGLRAEEDGRPALFTAVQ